jgi:HME family heavy-metal exporter
MTEAAGLAPEEVETLVTYPLESALLGATGVQAVRSQSGPGLSVVSVDFDWNTNIYTARQVVQERLAALGENLPEGVRPQMAPISSIMGQVIIAGLYRQVGPGGGELAPLPGTGLLVERLPGNPPALKVWKPTDRRRPVAWEAVPVDGATWAGRRATVTLGGVAHTVSFPAAAQPELGLRTLADWVVRPRLLKTAGVAQVVTMGGGRKQYQVLVDPTALTEYDVSLQQIEAALKANNVNASGGLAAEGETERPIRVLGRLGPVPGVSDPGHNQVLADLRKIPVKTTPHRTILLEQVARVEAGPQVKRGDASVNGRPGVVLTITKQPHVDTRDLTNRVAAALRDEAEAALPADVVVVPDLFQLKGFIDRGVANVAEALRDGAVLVLVILFLFLWNVRTTFISLTAIPLSLVLTTLAFRLIGWLTGTALSINVMTLGGIAVAMGELVDDAVVDVENIFRRLKENSARPEPRPALQVVYDASREIRSAIVFGTLVVILVFLPLFALSGIEGRLFAPLGVAYITAILASLLVSLTVTPVLSYYLLPQAKATHAVKDGFLLWGLKWLGGHLIRFSMTFAVPLLVLTWAAVGLCVWVMCSTSGPTSCRRSTRAASR